MGCLDDITLAGIGLDCGGSKGGIVEAWIAPYKQGLFTVSGDTCTLASETVGNFKHFYFRKGTSSFTSTLNIDNSVGVNYVSTEITLVFNRMCAAKRIQMKALATAPLAVVVKDGNGKYWGFGVEDAVNASAGEGASGTAATDGNHYSITLLDECSVWPYQLTNGTGLEESYVDTEC